MDLCSGHASYLDFFDPVVPDWTPERQAREIEERARSDVALYCLTPKMTGVYSIAEVVDDCHGPARGVVLVVLDEDGDEVFPEAMSRSLGAVEALVRSNGGVTFRSLEAAARHIGGLVTAATRWRPYCHLYESVAGLPPKVTETTLALLTSALGSLATIGEVSGFVDADPERVLRPIKAGYRRDRIYKDPALPLVYYWLMIKRVGWRGFWPLPDVALEPLARDMGQDFSE
jgi:hypothetical protein